MNMQVFFLKRSFAPDIRSTTANRRLACGIRLIGSGLVRFLKPNQPPSGNGVQNIPVSHGQFQIAPHYVGMFPSQGFRARAFPEFDGIDERAMMLLCNGNEFP